MPQVNNPLVDSVPLHPSRRVLLRTALAALAGISLWKFVPVRNNRDASLDAFTSRLIRTLGLHKLASIPDAGTLMTYARFREQELAVSLTELFKIDVTRDQQILTWSKKQLRDHLQAAIVNDYRTGMLVQMHGWWMSKTESLCFALAALY